MTREEVARWIRWERMVWVLVFVNPLFLVPQLGQILWTRETEALSLSTLVIIICIQCGFGLHGFFNRDRPLMVTNVVGGAVTFMTISAVVYFRYSN